MRRLIFSLAAGTGLLAAVMPGAWVARAADSAAGSLQAITGASGYQFQVPADWQQLPLSLQERVGNQTFADDGEVASADGTQRAHVETATGFGITPDNIGDALTAFLSGSPNTFAGQGPSVPGASAPPPASTPSPSTTSASAPPLPGVPALTVYAAASTVPVKNADAAMAGAATYTDAKGGTRVLAARLAVRGTSSFLLVIDSSQDFYQTNPMLGQIESSFQLTSGASTP